MLYKEQLIRIIDGSQWFLVDVNTFLDGFPIVWSVTLC